VDEKKLRQFGGDSWARPLDLFFPPPSAAGVDYHNKNKTKQNYGHKLKPLGDRVLVEPAEEKETKKGGIIIPIPPRKTTEGIVVPRHRQDR
jgi:hypothetical protein